MMKGRIVVRVAKELARVEGSTVILSQSEATSSSVSNHYLTVKLRVWRLKYSPS